MDIQDIVQLISEEEVNRVEEQADKMQFAGEGLDLGPMNMIAFE